MFILFLDDNQVRHDSAEKAFTNSGHTLLHAFTQEDVLQILNSCQERIGLAMLDYDLDQGEPTGSEIASQVLNTIAEEKWPARVIVHSNNPDGALNIISKFRNADVFAEYRPFGIGAGYWKNLIDSLKME